MDPTITGISGIILGTLLGAWLGYRFSLSLSKIIEKKRAALKLRQAFKGELLALNPAHHIIEGDLPNFLEKAFRKHEGAVFDFSFFLDAKTKTAFYKAWEEYYCHPDQRNENCIPFFEQYSCRGLTVKEIHNMKNLAKSRIEAILKFTKI